MSIFFGKTLIFLGCILFNISIYSINTSFVITMLVAFIVCFWDGFNYKNVNIPVFLYLITSLFIPQFRIYLPLTIWNLHKSFNPFAISLYFIGTLLSIFEKPGNGSFIFLLFMCFLSLTCTIICQLITSNQMLSQKLKQMRDNSKEHELLIEEKNKVLIENQDNNIHMATLKERNRIAREIHDNVGHMLTRSILLTGALKAINKDATVAEHLDSLHNTLNTAMTNIRESVHDLHDESVNLKNVINDIITSTSTLSIHFNYDMSQDIPRNIKYCFISIIKEGINNTQKHSNGDKMTILLREHPGFYQLLIEDNGTNIAPNFNNGIGLTNIYDRINALGGNLKILTENGFKIHITINK
ncbi:MAG: sensor histidine kinase [Lachnospiraceae bacterium]|nr:sensor histidine kinase [Lachnospiraceae bacterium]